jgi:hypothetical protein
MRNLPFVESLERRSLLSGVTIITHGQGGDAKDDEIELAANLVAQRAGGASQYIMTVEQEGVGAKVTSFVRDAGSPDPNSTANGEIVIKLDYSDVSKFPMSIVGRAVVDYLLADASVTGHRLVEQELAMVGPSRGGPVISEIAGNLARRGVWVDHLVFLDPVPIPFFDPDLVLTDNVIFADDYWRDDGNLLNEDFDGRPIDGAHNAELTVVQEHHTIGAHPSVAAYYLATIDPNMPLVAPARSEWFTSPWPARNETGFAFSRIAGGQRPADGVARSHGGTGSRVAVKRNSTQWANVDDLRLLGGNFTVPAGQWLRVSMRMEDMDSRSTVSLYLDQDTNP